MKTLIESFPQQLEKAIEIGETLSIENPIHEIKNVIIAGMGGSGIAGNIVGELIGEELNVPLNSCKSYGVPNYVDKHTLFVASSYSGNTEETLSSTVQAVERAAQVIAITTGGKLEEVAQEHVYPMVKLEGGNPPRSALGYSLVAQLYVLYQMNLISSEFKKQLVHGIALLKSEQEAIKEETQKIAATIAQSLPVIYTNKGYEGVATRWQQQFNENADMLSWTNTIPEMNHNEIVGWSSDYKMLSVLFLKDEMAHPRNLIRMKTVQDIVGKYVENVVEIRTKGDSLLEKMLYLIHFGDWLSLYLSSERGVDPMNIANIDFLKAELAKQ